MVPTECRACAGPAGAPDGGAACRAEGDDPRLQRSDCTARSSSSLTEYFGSAGEPAVRLLVGLVTLVLGRRAARPI